MPAAALLVPVIVVAAATTVAVTVTAIAGVVLRPETKPQKPAQSIPLPDRPALVPQPRHARTPAGIIASAAMLQPVLGIALAPGTAALRDLEQHHLRFPCRPPYRQLIWDLSCRPLPSAAATSSWTDQPFRILSGAIHYFRVHPDLWADRIRKARLMGLNTIETYVPWNEHSPTPGSFRTDGGLDLGRFLDLVADAGHAGDRPARALYLRGVGQRRTSGVAVHRPHHWRAQQRARLPGRRVRVHGPVLPIVVRGRSPAGGPVVLFQIENEYGAYGSDKAYLQHLVDTVQAGRR